MKITFLVSFRRASVYRTLLPCYGLRDLGHDVSIATSLTDPKVRDADILVLQDASKALASVEACASAGLVLSEGHRRHTEQVRNGNSLFVPTISATFGTERGPHGDDGRMSSSPQIGSDYASAAMPGNLLHPNMIDDRHFHRMAPAKISGDTKRLGEIRIGCTLQVGRLRDLLAVLPALVKVMREDDRVRFVSIGCPVSGHFPVDLRPRVELLETNGRSRLDPDESLLAMMNYYDTIRKAELDIAVAPLHAIKDDRAASDVNLKEYGAVGYPTIASRTDPYRAYQRRAWERVIMLAGNQSEWEVALRSLIIVPEKRATLARANLAYVRSRYLVSQAIAAWERVLLETFGRDFRYRL